jgi:hypothetical protein
VVVGLADPNIVLVVVVTLDSVQRAMTLGMVEGVMMQDMVEEAVIQIMEAGVVDMGLLLLLAEVEVVDLTMTHRG